ncbi:MAG: hypothetical protein WCK09_01755 [Bacteroidota bacterium]
MRKFIFVTAFIMLAGLNGLFAQQYQTYPIPSFNCQLSSTNSAFKEQLSHANPTREKREMDVVISSSSTHPQLVSAKVWVVKEGGSIIKGPYRIYLDQPLSVPIDHGKWGVVLNCKYSNVSASVWID